MAQQKPASRVCVLGIFVADAAFRAARLPALGETLIGSGFALGPGGKGSNQAVAASRLGGTVDFLTRTGDDAFADMAGRLWREAGVTAHVERDVGSQTGAAGILVEEAGGRNAIIVCPGAARGIDAAWVDGRRATIESATVFLTQLEQPLAAALRGLEIARAAGATTILNPAPAQPLADTMLALCDWVTPNETEAGMLAGFPVADADAAARAGEALIARGAGNAVITLGEKGALLISGGSRRLVPAVTLGPAVDTTGAGDAFNGGFAVALARGLPPFDAVRYGSLVAGLSVTKSGAAASMPTQAEVDRVWQG